MFERPERLQRESHESTRTCHPSFLLQVEGETMEELQRELEAFRQQTVIYMRTCLIVPSFARK